MLVADVKFDEPRNAELALNAMRKKFDAGLGLTYTRRRDNFRIVASDRKIMAEVVAYLMGRDRTPDTAEYHIYSYSEEKPK